MIRKIALVAALSLSSTLASAAEPIRFAVTDIEGLEALQQEFGQFEKSLEEVTGLDIELFPVNSRTAAVEALNAEMIDLVLTGPAEYVVLKEMTDAKIVVAWQRPDYYAQIVTLSDGPIKSVEDLKGKTVTFGSVGSTSQHLGPAQVLTDFGLAYASDYDAQIISRNVAAEALIRGDIAAIGMNRSHLNSIREAYPEVSFTVVARGRDLPNDIMLASSKMDEATFNTIRTAFVEHGKDLMSAVLQGDDNQKFKGGFFLTDVQDSDYDYVRAMYRTIGIDTFTQFVGN